MIFKKDNIDSFLKDLYISAANDNIILNDRTVYSYLIRRNVLASDLDKGVKNAFFDKWIDNFRKVNNIEVFWDPNWSYFCQFQNGEYDKENNYIKMYVPLDYNHLFEGVNRIFKFLSSNNIKHKSKVSSKIRVDDVVIRLSNEEDAKLLQKFLDNDKYIQEGLMKENTFAFSNGGISYNFYVSSLIADYINISVQKGIRISDINTNSFNSYLNVVSKDLNRVASLLSKTEAQDDKKVIDAFNVIKLLQGRLASNNMKYFSSYYNALNNNTHKNQLSHSFKEDNEYTEILDKDSLFSEFILTTMKKYPLGYDEKNPNVSGFNYIYSYLKGNDKAVTRENNLRERINNNLSKEDIYSIINKNSINGNTLDEKVLNYINMIVLNDIISSMMKRFPNTYIINLKKFMISNDFKLITNSVGNARKLVHTMDASEIKKFLNSINVCDIEEYINKYYSFKNEENRRR